MILKNLESRTLEILGIKNLLLCRNFDLKEQHSMEEAEWFSTMFSCLLRQEIRGETLKSVLEREKVHFVFLLWVPLIQSHTISW